MNAETIDPTTGEILLAADGAPMPPMAATLADTLRILNDGRFDTEASEDLRALIVALDDFAQDARGGKAKGTFTVNLDIVVENGAHIVTPTVKIKAPVRRHMGTLLFADGDGRLSRNPHGQRALFGVRVVKDDRTPVRTV